MCCKLKLKPDWMYCFRGRGLAMLCIFLVSMVGSICVQIMHNEISLDTIPYESQKINIGLRVGSIGLSNNRMYTQEDNSTLDMESSQEDISEFNISRSEIREYYLIWHRPETLFEKLMIWMCYFTFYTYNTLLSFCQIIIATFFKTSGNDLYRSTNCFTVFLNCMLVLLTIATVKETISSTIAFTLEICTTAFSMILKYNVFPLFAFVPDLQMEVRRYLSRDEEISLDVSNYLRDRGYSRSRANSMVYTNFEHIVGDVERESGTNEEDAELTAVIAGTNNEESYI